LVLLVAATLASGALHGQNAGQAQTDSAASRVAKYQPHAPKEIGSIYRKWLDEDVRWIITEEERAAFLKLPTDSERDQFVEEFWSRRNPKPGAPRNAFKEEHYGRIAYANLHFSSRTLRGWETDRGHVYILYGQADSIDSHPQNTIDRCFPDTCGIKMEAYPFEVWRYSHLEGIGNDIELEFVDRCRCGEYKMRLDKQRDRLVPVRESN
jgi:GWxTD domain-containing protein